MRETDSLQLMILVQSLTGSWRIPPYGETWQIERCFYTSLGITDTERNSTALCQVSPLGGIRHDPVSDCILWILLHALFAFGIPPFQTIFNACKTCISAPIQIESDMPTDVHILLKKGYRRALNQPGPSPSTDSHGMSQGGYYVGSKL